MAQEGARAGITVNTICPGYIATEMVKAISPEIVAKNILPQIPVGRSHPSLRPPPRAYGTGERIRHGGRQGIGRALMSHRTAPGSIHLQQSTGIES
ncbi:hypothetical protein BwSF19_77280 [Bradyrhizobium ottawaense]|nr:hypothetical protein BwSF19_77280 [Bradyrhizobium ottawaense]